jgi:hypothetical protein
MRRSTWSVPVATSLLAFAGGAVFAAARPDLGWRPGVVNRASALHAHEPSPSAEPARKVAVATTPVPRSAPLGEAPVFDANRDVTGDRFPSGLKVLGAMPHRMILFTFDDGPSRETTPRVLDVLDRLGIKALFFVSTQSFGKGNPWEREHAEISSETTPRRTGSFPCCATPRSERSWT